MSLSVGTSIFAMANKEPKNSNTSNKQNIVNMACTITATCPDGSTISATASSCEKAGKMIDAGCQ